MREGDFVVLLQDQEGDGGKKGHIYKLNKPGWPQGLEPVWLIVTKSNPLTYAIVTENICKLLPTKEVYMIVASHFERGAWGNPYTMNCDSLEGFRQEVRWFEENPQNNIILAKKRITIPYQDPDEEMILPDEPVVVPQVEEDVEDEDEDDFPGYDEEEDDLL